MKLRSGGNKMNGNIFLNLSLLSTLIHNFMQAQAQYGHVVRWCSARNWESLTPAEGMTLHPAGRIAVPPLGGLVQPRTPGALFPHWCGSRKAVGVCYFMRPGSFIAARHCDRPNSQSLCVIWGSRQSVRVMHDPDPSDKSIHTWTNITDSRMIMGPRTIQSTVSSANAFILNFGSGQEN